MFGKMSSFVGSLGSEVPLGIVRRGLVVYLDALNPNSYAGSGTTWADLSGRVPSPFGTINNLGTGNITYVSSGSATHFNWATANTASYIYTTRAINILDMTIAFQPDFTLNNDAGLVGLMGTSNSVTSNDKSIRFQNANGVGPWRTKNPGNADDWANTATTFYINGVATTTDANLNAGWNIFGGGRTNTTNGVFASSWTYYLGTEGTGSAAPYREFKGKMAVVCLYNRVLTAAEQIQNFNALRSRFGL